MTQRQKTARRPWIALLLPLWLVAVVPVIILASVPTSNAAQAMLGVAALLLVLLL